MAMVYGRQSSVITIMNFISIIPILILVFIWSKQKIYGPWSEPVLVEAGKGLIDPCPFGMMMEKYIWFMLMQAAVQESKSIIVVKELNKEGTKIISDAVMVYDGHETDPTIEGPKFYKRNGYYYIFAPAGGVRQDGKLFFVQKIFMALMKEK